MINNPAQVVVDNATSAMASQTPTMVRKRELNQGKSNGRTDAIARRLSQMKKPNG
jgi:hypothetical protein